MHLAFSLCFVCSVVVRASVVYVFAIACFVVVLFCVLLVRLGSSYMMKYIILDCFSSLLQNEKEEFGSIAVFQTSKNRLEVFRIYRAYIWNDHSIRYANGIELAASPFALLRYRYLSALMICCEY